MPVRAEFDVEHRLPGRHHFSVVAAQPIEHVGEYLNVGAGREFGHLMAGDAIPDHGGGKVAFDYPARRIGPDIVPMALFRRLPEFKTAPPADAS